MRIILYTGKGGVGKTSIAAATACKIAKNGKKVLIMSTDQAHSLRDSFEHELSNDPMQIRENLYAVELDLNIENEKLWGKTKQYIEKVLLFKSSKSIQTEELLVFPGFEELIALLKIKDYAKENFYDVLIIDCAPTGESMSLLKFPELFKWWMAKVFPMKKAAAKIAKPIVETALKFPIPDKYTFAEIEELYTQLEELHELLLDKETTSIRIVTTPEKIVINEAKRNFTNLHLFDFNIDALIINRIFSEDGAEGYFEKWLTMQNTNIKNLYNDFSPVPIFKANLLDNELKGYEALDMMGKLIYKDVSPEEVLWRDKIFVIEKVDNYFNFKINMPFVDKNDLDIYQNANEISIVVKNEKRSFILPKKLHNKEILKAVYKDKYLNIQFQ